MAVRAQHRIHRTSVYIVAAIIVAALSTILWFKVGWAAAQIVLQATGLVAVAIMFGEFLTKHWLWKTRLGNKLGFPPDYSGNWAGKVYRTKKENEIPDENRVEVTISQTITQIEWHQIGFNDSGEQIAESHFILGEVIDDHRKWDAILGVYEEEAWGRATISNCFCMENEVKT